RLWQRLSPFWNMARQRCCRRWGHYNAKDGIKPMATQFKNIRNVKLLPEDPPAYLCELDLKLPDEGWEAVEYCARPGGGGICDDVIAAIQRGEFEGTITD